MSTRTDLRSLTELLTKHQLDGPSKSSANRWRSRCPECSSSRSSAVKRKEKCVAVKCDSEGITWFCHNGNCSFQGGAYYAVVGPRQLAIQSRHSGRNSTSVWVAERGGKAQWAAPSRDRNSLRE